MFYCMHVFNIFLKFVLGYSRHNHQIDIILLDILQRVRDRKKKWF